MFWEIGIVGIASDTDAVVAQRDKKADVCVSREFRGIARVPHYGGETLKLGVEITERIFVGDLRFSFGLVDATWRKRQLCVGC